MRISSSVFIGWWAELKNKVNMIEEKRHRPLLIFYFEQSVPHSDVRLLGVYLNYRVLYWENSGLLSHLVTD